MTSGTCAGHQQGNRQAAVHLAAHGRSPPRPPAQEILCEQRRGAFGVAVRDAALSVVLTGRLPSTVSGSEGGARKASCPRTVSRFAHYPVPRREREPSSRASSTNAL